MLLKDLGNQITQWIVSLIHKTLYYLNSDQVVELQPYVMSCQEKRARTLLWSNNPPPTVPSCDLLSDSLKTERNTRDPCPSPLGFEKNSLRRRHSCSKIGQPSSLNPKPREWVPYLKMDYSQG